MTRIFSVTTQSGTGAVTSAHQATLYHAVDGCDLRPTNHYRARRFDIGAVVLHWPGNSVATAKRTFRCFKAHPEPVSSHFAIDHTDTLQMLPLDTVAFHAGAANGRSIGVDVCQPQSNAEIAEEWGFRPPGTQKIRTVTYLLLDPRVATRVAEVLRALAQDIGKPLRFRPEGEKRKRIEDWIDDSFLTVVMHADLPGTKMDIVPWFATIQAAYGTLMLPFNRTRADKINEAVRFWGADGRPTKINYGMRNGKLMWLQPQSAIELMALLETMAARFESAHLQKSATDTLPAAELKIDW